MVKTLDYLNEILGDTKITAFNNHYVENGVIVLEGVTLAIKGINCIKMDRMYIHEKLLPKKESRAAKLEKRITNLETAVKYIESTLKHKQNIQHTY